MQLALSKKLRILIIVDPGLPVPPIGYGGIERVAGLLAEEYQCKGHSVTILASKGSSVEGCLVYSNGNQGFPQSTWARFKALINTWTFLFMHHRKFDLIQNFGRLIYFLPVLNLGVKKIMCYQREISIRNINYFIKLPKKNMFLSGCSKDLVSDEDLKGKWKVIYNPVKTLFYDGNFSNNNKKPLIFLSRINKEKGCHIAISVAKKTKNTLIIAGNSTNQGEEGDYFKEFIYPHIDGKQIIYVGEVNDEQKNFYLGNAKAMLFPIIWDEPFGIVMIESMACGTPVIAFNRGSVDEVIDEGITGFKVNNEEEMALAINKIQDIDREICRNQAQKRFDIGVIADNYLSLVECP